MKYSLQQIAQIIDALPSPADEVYIEHLLLDSRKVHAPASSLFFALKGPARDGHQFIPELVKKGVRSFVISEIPAGTFENCHFLVVDDTLAALHQLAIFHRKKFTAPVIGITGSNGKTITKEWLFQLLHQDHHIVRSPKSYNSQIGVPLSVWQMNEQHTLGIFEAGISQPGEMENLEKIISPTIGVLTNIGEAHSEGFENAEQKLAEKLKLFTHCELIIARGVDILPHKELLPATDNKPALLTWGFEPGNDLVVKKVEKEKDHSTITVCFGATEKKFFIPFADDAAVQNAICCYFILVQMGVEDHIIEERMAKLQPVNMRLELKKAINHCLLINDSYSADINSLEIALDFLKQQSGELEHTVIISDLRETARKDAQLYGYILESLKKHRVSRVIGIGEHISASLRSKTNEETGMSIELYLSTEEFIERFRSTQFRDEAILVKGARIFGFERIVQLLEQKMHQTVLEINLNAIVQNVRVYQSQLKPGTKIMAMVKAFAYGSGGAEIAGILQYHKVDYLGVAYADEGVELRKAGVMLPVMVMNPEPAAFESLVEYKLEPDLYSIDLLLAFEAYLRNEGLQDYPVHIEIETGMNRLGVPVNEVSQLAAIIAGSGILKVQSVFSHLVGSEDPAQDLFTATQVKLFTEAASLLQEKLKYPFLRHICNSAAIFRFPEFQMDMVRLGIGMYGVDGTNHHQSLLQQVATLKTTIAQVKKINAGDSVGYNRKSIVDKDTLVATVRIGYADGYSRKLGNGAGKMWINPAQPGVQGMFVPVIGSICMDMTMIDVTASPHVREGDEVIVFGRELPISDLAQWAGTIPYEIMTSISQRVKRVYYEE